MNCKINPQAINNPHIKAAFNNAKVMGITGKIVHVFPETNDIIVVFTHDSDGNFRNQVFPMDSSWVNVEVENA